MTDEKQIAAPQEMDDSATPIPPPAPRKKTASAQAPSELKLKAASIAVRPESGRVLVYDKDGAVLARYTDRAQARTGLEAAGVDPGKVEGGGGLAGAAAGKR